MGARALAGAFSGLQKAFTTFIALQKLQQTATTEAEKIKLQKAKLGLDSFLAESQIKLNNADTALKKKQTEELDENNIKQTAEIYGGVSLTDEQRKIVAQKMKVPPELFIPEYNKKGEKTDNFSIPHPDHQKMIIEKLKMNNQAARDELQRMRAGMEQMRLKLATMGEEREQNKFDLFKKTPQKTVETRGGDIVGIMPGGDIRKLGLKAPLSPGIQKETAEQEAGFDFLKNYDSLFDKRFVGKIDASAGKIREFTGVIGEKQANFYAAEATVKNEMIRLITGAQVSVQEAERIEKQIPTRFDADQVWKSKMKQTKLNRKMLIDRIRQRTGQGKLPDEPIISLEKMNDKQLERFINGSMSNDEFLRITR